MIKVIIRGQKSHPNWMTLKLQPIGLTFEQLGLSTEQLHKISK